MELSPSPGNSCDRFSELEAFLNASLWGFEVSKHNSQSRKATYGTVSVGKLECSDQERLRSKIEHNTRCGGFFGTRISNFDHRSLKSKSAGDWSLMKQIHAHIIALYTSERFTTSVGFVFWTDSESCPKDFQTGTVRSCRQLRQKEIVKNQTRVSWTLANCFNPRL